MCMAIYHFCFDLNMAGIMHQAMNNDISWRIARACIVTTFLLLVGASLVLSEQKQAGKPARFSLRSPYWKRVAKLVVCAALVSVGSMMLFPESYIFFGVLHCIVIASLVGKAMLRFDYLNLVVGISIVLLGLFYQHAMFNQPWWQWVGMMTFKPVTEDYVPLFPWLGVVLIGMFGMKWLQRSSPFSTVQPSGIASALAWMGRHSLAIYMLHQPILLGLLWLGIQLWN